MPIVRPSVRAFAVGEDSRPSGFMFVDGRHTATFEFRCQAELDEVSSLLAGQLSCTPSSIRLARFLADHPHLFDRVKATDVAAFAGSHYSRQLSYYAAIGGVASALACQECIDASLAVIVGVGGIGCHLADHLARIGVRDFVLVDFDRVEASNLNRQVLFDARDIGARKIDAASARLGAAHGDALRVRRFEQFEPAMADELAGRPGMIFISADRGAFALRRAVTAAAFPIGVPYAFLGYSGQTASITMVSDASAGCGACAVMGGRSEEWLRSLAAHKLLDTPPSAYAINAMAAALGVDMWTRRLLGAFGGAERLEFTLGTLEVRRAPAERDPSCPVCGSYA